MFFVVAGRRVDVRLRRVDRFWCLNCEAERGYQHREWRSAGTFFFMPLVGLSRGEFVLCDVCEGAFDLECLDESSTALCSELLMHVPFAAIRLELGGVPPGVSVEPPWVRATIGDALSANSSFRRH